MFLVLEGFKYDLSLDLNMGYCQFWISEYKMNWCMIIKSRSKYRNKYLPMGVSESPNIFQHKLNNYFQGFLFIYAYTENILILKKEILNITHKTVTHHK